MQLCAFDDVGSIVRARKAEKHCNYFCMECGQKVRLRSGLHRQAHFYHIHPNQVCRLSGKGMVHLLVQEKLQASLPEGDVDLEWRFPSINRIADVVWHSQKLIFEIQCSFITANEVLARNADYASMGYQVVWILHDRRYNQYRMTSAEDALQGSPHYFTNMNAEGIGEFYDQYSQATKGVRLTKLPRVTIALTQPIRKHEIDNSQKVPQALLRRINAWKVSFSGDCVDRFLKMNPIDAVFLQALEKLSIQDNRISMSLGNWLVYSLKRWVVVPYRAIFRLFLEKACR